MTASPLNPILELQQLTHSYAGSDQMVLEIDHWQIQKGQHVFLHGPSGSGKTTLLNLVSGVSLPRGGHVTVLGQNLNELSTRQRDRFRAQHIGVVFQQLNLIPYLSILDNILLAAEFNRNQRLSEKKLTEKARQLLTQLHMPVNLLQTKASQLSVGQQQRVAIVRAMINQPELLIADEPTSALDSDSRDAFIKLLFDMATANQTTLLFVSHDRQLATHFDLVQGLAEINQKATQPC